METFNQKFSEYFGYFENIRTRLFSLAVVFGIFFIVGFYEAGNILRSIIGIFRLDNATIVTTSPFQFLDLATKVGLYVGLLACLPLLIYHVYDFLKDGLTKKEKNLFFVLLPIGIILFVAGFAYCFIILYFYLSSVSTINLAFGIRNIWDISSFLSQIIMASICIGAAFQFPIVLSFLIRVGLIKVEYLRKHRFYAMAGIFIFVGFLPPPDIFSTILEALPLVILYQLTIWANSRCFSKSSYPFHVRDKPKRLTNSTVAIIGLAIMLASLISAHTAHAAMDKFDPGSKIVIGEFVYADDYTATSSDCTISIYDPDGNVIADAVPMDSAPSGWHSYSTTTISGEGTYPTTMTCGSALGGDLASISKTFMVGYTSASTTLISNAVWNSSATSSIAAAVNVNTNAAIADASSSLASSISAASSSIVASINAKMDSSVLAASTSIVASVNANTNSAIAAASSSIVSSVTGAVNANTNAIVNSASSSLASAINVASTSLAMSLPKLIWTYTGRTLDSIASIASDIGAAVWSYTLSGGRALTSALIPGSGTSLALQSDVTTATNSINSNTNNDIVSASVSLSSAISSSTSAVNASTGSQLASAISSINSHTDYIASMATTSLLSNLPGSIWNISTSTLTSAGSIGLQLATNQGGSGGGVSPSDLSSALAANNGVITSAISTASSSLAAAINTASSSLGSAINTVSGSLASAISAASSSLATTINSGVASTAAALAVNNAIIKSLNDTNAVWDYLGQVLHSGQLGSWATSLSDTDTIVVGNTLRAKVYVTNQWNATDPYAAPVVKIYDETHGTDPFLATTSSMNKVGTGIYEFVYTIPSNASAGTWETVVDTQVQVGQSIENSDYWTVQAQVSPPMVAVNGIMDNVIPDISASTTIKNEGVYSDEYQYEWCVTTAIDGSCEDGSAVYYGGLKSQLLAPGQIIHPELDATVPNAGDYFMKLVVYYNGGDQVSHSIYPFTAISGTVTPPVVPPIHGGGGGGGGGGSGLNLATTTPVLDNFNKADLNRDGKVNSIDFSILLYYWKSKPPFANKYVDINKDGKVDSVDFSIMLYNWSKK